jgi:translocation and assembly module TamB
MRRVAKWIGGILAGLAALLVLLLVFANTPPGRDALTWLVPRVTGDTVRIVGLSGRFPDALRATGVELRDARGAYATVQGLVLDWSPLQLMRGRLVIGRLDAADVAALRMPVSSSQSSGQSMAIELHELRVARLEISQALAGTAAAVALDGSAALASSTDLSGNLHIRDLGGAGDYSVSAAADARRLHVSLHGEEPPGGLLVRLAGMQDLGAVRVDATLDGPRDAVATTLALAVAELHAKADGRLDLEHEAADFTVSAGAPAMQPRPDIGWQAISVEAHVSGPFTRPDATGHVRIDSLTAVGVSIAQIVADVAGNAGRLRLDGSVSGLRVPGPPGPYADLLAADPLSVEADAKLDEPDRPVHVTLRHRLFAVDANALTGEHRVLDASLRLPELASVAAVEQVALQGALALNLHATMAGDATTLTADGTLGVTGGQPQAQALVGEEGRFSVAAAVHGSDLTISQLRFTGRAASLEASGQLVANQLNLGWSVAVSDLAAAEPRLAGDLRANGTVTGAPDDLSMKANIGGRVAAEGMASGPLTVEVEASGLPIRPSGRITARGDLLDAPVDLAVALRQEGDGLAIDIERASWKSLEAGGAVQLPAATMVPTGDLHLSMTRLADLAPLLGRPIAGSIRAAISAPAGTARPTMDARIEGEGLEVNGMRGTVQVSASGTMDALDVKLAAAMPALQGSPMRLSAAAAVEASRQTVRLQSLQAEWHQQTLRLLAPARFGFADGVTIDNLRVGLRQAVLEVSGRASPTLDLTATLRNLPADLVGADGTIRADARVTGTPTRPVGKVSLAATGLRLRSGSGRAMPAANITAGIDLNGATARIDCRVTAGTSRLAVTGSAPLSAAGGMDLRANGALDLAMLEPILAAGGRQVRGHVTLDATVTGTVAAPRVAGSARLAGGEVQDYVSGLHLSDIAVQVEGSGGTLRIAKFSAKAGDGSITGSGSVGVLSHGMPVELTITAHDAKPLASDLITAVIDTDLALRGEALGQLAVSGTVRIKRAEMRIPERIPAAIAVLPVRQPGASPPPSVSATSTIVLNITVDAPNQIFVRGRGIDVEFGGRVKLGGTASAPRTEGGLDLQRGSISLAGRTIDFTRGRVSFNGGSISDPALDLLARSSSGNVTATLEIGGTAREPKITLTSVPPLPQDEVLAHLLFGSSSGQLGALELAQIASSLATLTGAGGGVGDPLDKVRQGLGLDRLGVRSGANGSPALEAGRYIAPRVYMGARQSASGGTQALVQFDITRRLKVEATAGTGSSSATGASSEPSGSGVGLTYQFEY